MTFVKRIQRVSRYRINPKITDILFHRTRKLHNDYIGINSKIKNYRYTNTRIHSHTYIHTNIYTYDGKKRNINRNS